MRKVILNLAVSLDSYIEDANGANDWCLADQDYGMSEFFSNVDTLFIGRKSYEMIAGMEDEYFPSIQKIVVFSDTLILEGRHPKVVVISSNSFNGAVNSIINAEGGDIWMFGGASLIAVFMEKKLISEFILSVHPVILGGGKPLFQSIQERTNLVLTDTKTYNTGLVQLHYTLKPVFDFNILKTEFTNSGLES